jgi:4-amino-4-deoxy-L-arabinose transferase-like glycosyltransferase
MEVDASQYASMSLEMLQNKSWLSITDLGENYLDKPPLLFWLSSISINLFGNSSWAFKLPSFIMAWFSVYFLFQLTKIYYQYGIAQFASLVYAGTVGFILFTNDIRTDTLLISFVVLATWQIALYLEKNKLQNLIIASIALGMAMLAKGPIGLMVPLLAVMPHFILKGKLKSVLNWRLLLVPIILLLVLSPMLIGLYNQWGIHGIKFFFWEQSFGRLTGENTWQNDATSFYFLHNIAWAFLPFTVFLILGFTRSLWKFKAQKEYISLFGFLLPFIALSLSHYKLPHYIYIVIPFAAIISAKWIHKWLNKDSKLDLVINIFQSIIIFALFLTGLVLLYFFQAFYWYLSYLILVVLLIYVQFRFENFKSKLFYMSFIVFMNCTFILNGFAYPNLLEYQSSSSAALYIQKENQENLSIYQLNIWWRAFHYYSGTIVPPFEEKVLEKTESILLFTDEFGYKSLEHKYKLAIVQKFPQFSVTRLSLNFLNPKTRKHSLSYTYLLKLEKKP